MKKLTSIISALLITITFAACSRGPHVVIASNDNNNEMKLEFSGQVRLNDARNAIAYISHDGYVSFTRNDREVTATTENGRIVYQLNDGDKKPGLDADNKAFFAEAIRLIAKQQANRKPFGQ